MTIESTEFKGLLVLEPTVYTDARGSFMESFNEARFRVETGLNVTFVQDNESTSIQNTLRGLHFQVPPKAQAKLVRVAQGAAWDVVVDLRVTQPTFGKWYKILLTSENRKQLFIPEGFAHGFWAVEEKTVFSYKCTNYYSGECDRSLRWNDATLGIDWGVDQPIISDKDGNAMLFSEFKSPFF
ncbi:MAG: dTDP-4-dehydrorhamnose 3,5-epimerase [Flavobacteriales bacterium]|jgi:dTDP-4-dehydrorhamnose 3,5-epimerase